jgi:hypothetical protein
MGTAVGVVAKSDLPQAPGWLVAVIMAGVLIAGAFLVLVILWGIADRARGEPTARERRVDQP